jgi:hypothetical protein
MLKESYIFIKILKIRYVYIQESHGYGRDMTENQLKVRRKDLRNFSSRNKNKSRNSTNPVSSSGIWLKILRYDLLCFKVWFTMFQGMIYYFIYYVSWYEQTFIFS